MGERVFVKRLLNAVEIAASGDITTPAKDLRYLNLKPEFAIFLTVAGLGTAKVEFLVCSEEDGTYLTPGAASDIIAAQTVGSDLVAFVPELAPFIKFKVSETLGANTITVTMYLIYK